MNDYKYFLLDIFTDRAFAGNPLAVFPQAEGMDADTMQAIANELNLSETVFVGQTSDAERYPIRIFTPTMELPFAGHPTVGTAHLLAKLGMARRDHPLVLEADVGPLVVNFEKDRARFTAAQPVDFRASTLNPHTAARLLGLDDHQIISQPVLASCGLPYHLIELDSLEALGRARPSPSVWADWVTPSGYEQIYLHAADKAAGPERTLRSRMFSTEGGIREDPATGSAAAALAGHLATEMPNPGQSHWLIHQGVEMGRPSQIFAEAEHDGHGITIRIAGQAVVIGSGMISLPG
ncbi:PhzF family phenazine biosynthesis protein [Modicisalibacter xianhensis]|uniref:Trans-2,3-dihydro-3-hydroxyanthranilate isomerase n=1 Tax=Modicisalibacter xianhensis TaxID=442341 RepID=A0A1I2Y0Y4_9GAMM|nr:PhzF family phenazine biosynthesis protein [Halomonas xianhensis]SFH19285.1 trans-2,3-dihydro-3-hydroxyanthranilate isomerase [Halomonas xianhensis]